MARPPRVIALDVASRVGLVAAYVLVALALIIVLGILFVVFDGNRDNGIVSGTLDVADALVGPFDRLFTPDGMKKQVFVNYGIAAVLYLVVAAVVRRVSARGSA